MDTFGIICFTETPYGRLYNIVRRKDSLSFIHLLRGRVTQDNLPLYWAKMTSDEKRRIKTKSFRDLCRDCWSIYKYNSIAEEHFNNLDFTNLPQEPSQDLEWSFPKGRKDFTNETDILCAVREYREETGNQNMLRLVMKIPITIKNPNVNGKIYYYLTETSSVFESKTYILPISNRSVISEETSESKWIYSWDAEKYLCDEYLLALRVCESLRY